VHNKICIINFVYILQYIFYIASEVTVCEQMSCKFANENTHSGTSSSVELESLSSLLCLEKTEKDNTIATFIKTFLELMKHTLLSNSKNSVFLNICYK